MYGIPGAVFLPPILRSAILRGAAFKISSGLQGAATGIVPCVSHKPAVFYFLLPDPRGRGGGAYVIWLEDKEKAESHGEKDRESAGVLGQPEREETR